MPADKIKELDKDLIETLLKEMANKYRKIDKKGYQPVDIIIVGGGSIILNYGFRPSTVDVDAIIKASNVINDIALSLSYKYEISSHWFNADFTILSSYSPRLLEVSEYYKSYNNDKFNIRTVKSEYLIAMKMQSGRFYNDDIPDIVGIIASEKKCGNELTYEKINKALDYLYEDKKNVSHEIIERVSKYCDLSIDDLWEEYDNLQNKVQQVKEEIMTDENKEQITGKQDAKELSEKLFLKLSHSSHEDHDIRNSSLFKKAVRKSEETKEMTSLSKSDPSRDER